MKANLVIDDDWLDWADWFGGLVGVGEDMTGVRCGRRVAT